MSEKVNTKRQEDRHKVPLCAGRPSTLEAYRRLCKRAVAEGMSMYELTSSVLDAAAKAEPDELFSGD